MPTKKFTARFHVQVLDREVTCIFVLILPTLSIYDLQDLLKLQETSTCLAHRFLTLDLKSQTQILY